VRAVALETFSVAGRKDVKREGTATERTRDEFATPRSAVKVAFPLRRRMVAAEPGSFAP